MRRKPPPSSADYVCEVPLFSTQIVDEVKYQSISNFNRCVVINYSGWSLVWEQYLSTIIWNWWSINVMQLATPSATLEIE